MLNMNTLAQDSAATLAESLHIDFSEVNWLAVVVVALVTFMLGGLWYGPLFSKPWIAAQGWTAERVEQIKRQMNPIRFFGGMILSYLVLATLLAVLINALNVSGVASGLTLGLLVWLIVAAITFTHQLASGRTMAAFAIDACFELVYLLTMSAVLAVWR